VEAVRIVRALFDTGNCTFQGEHYTITVPAMPGFDDVPAPLLVGALGGDRTIKGAGPHLDRIELKASSPATRGGAMDHAFAAIPRSHLVDLIEKARRAAGDAGIAFYARCGVGDDPLTRELATLCVEPEGLYTGLFGPPHQVAERLHAFSELGITHINVSPTHPSAFELLAPYLRP
jgi:alkanesulfonate monooxygenase SsuD/methylene tetrahydromethanopterin reductase-like flavin-dependent oxidoreductase (luciferase family)